MLKIECGKNAMYIIAGAHQAQTQWAPIYSLLIKIKIYTYTWVSIVPTCCMMVDSCVIFFCVASDCGAFSVCKESKKHNFK